MRSRVFAIALLTLLGCERDPVSGESSSALGPQCDCPQEAYYAQYRHLRDADAPGLWALLSDKARADCEEQFTTWKTRVGEVSSSADEPQPRTAAEYCSYVGSRRRKYGLVEFPTPPIFRVEYQSPTLVTIRNDDTEQEFELIDGTWKVKTYSIVTQIPGPDYPIRVKLPDGKSGAGATAGDAGAD